MQNDGDASHNEVANLCPIQGIDDRFDLTDHRQGPSSGLTVSWLWAMVSSSEVVSTGNREGLSGDERITDPEEVSSVAWSGRPPSGERS